MDPAPASAQLALLNPTPHAARMHVQQLGQLLNAIMLFD
jgi:hypothetical protein